MNVRPLPRNDEAERSVLSAILTEPSCLPRVAAILEPEDFFREQNRVVYASALKLQEDSDPVDVVTVKDRLDQMGLLEKAGGYSGIAALLDQMPDIGHVERHAQIVKDDAQARLLIQECRRIAVAAYDRSEKLDSLVAEASSVFAASSRSLSRGVSSAKDSIVSVSRWIDSNEDPRSTKVGIKVIDDITGGYEAGVLHIVGARPGVGKTAIALSIALNIAEKGGRVLMFEMDMSRDMIDKRLVATYSGIPLWKIRNKKFLRPEDAAVIAKKSQGMARLDIVFDYQSRSIRQIQSQIRRYAKDEPLSLVIVDHIGHVRGGDGKDRYVQLGDVSSRLIEVAGQVDVPVLALSQLNRGALTDQREPKVSDLRESGNLEQDARTIFLLDRPNERKEHIPKCQLSLIVGKNEGPIGDVIPLHFNLDTQRVSGTGLCSRCSDSAVVTNDGVEVVPEQEVMLHAKGDA